LERADALEVGNREHFLRLAAKVMHRILVERPRARLSAKRGVDLVRVDEFEHLSAPTPMRSWPSIRPW
jgi:hypothetical protein